MDDLGRPPYEHWPILHRPRLELPGGARLAVWVGLNVEYYPHGVPGLSAVPLTADWVPDPMNQGWRDYGPRVGMWRIADVLERHGIPATAIVHSEAFERYPEIAEEGGRRGWCWLAHGQNNSLPPHGMDEAGERLYLGEMTDAIERHTGQRPRGWLGPALSETASTPALLAELGYSYLCDWCADDQPFPLATAGRMISLPYSIEVNDVTLFVAKGLTGRQYHDLLVDQFDTLWEQAEESALVMAIPLHAFLAGAPHRLRHLDRALGHIRGHEAVWLATADEIADWYLGECYEEAASLSSSYSIQGAASRDPSARSSS